MYIVVVRQKNPWRRVKIVFVFTESEMSLKVKRKPPEGTKEYLVSLI